MHVYSNVSYTHNYYRATSFLLRTEAGRDLITSSTENVGDS